MISEQIRVFQNHFDLLSVHVSDFQKEHTKEIWLKCSEKFKNILSFMGNEDFIEDHLVFELNHCFKGFMLPEFFMEISDSKNLKKCFHDFLSLIKSQKVTSVLSLEYLTTTLRLLYQYLQISKDPEVSDLILQNIEQLQDMALKAELLLGVADHYEKLRDHRQSAIYDAYGLHCAEQAKVDALVHRAQHSLARKETEFLYDLFCEESEHFVARQITLLARHHPFHASRDFCDQIFELGQLFFTWGKCEQATHCYQKLYDTLGMALAQDQFPENMIIKVRDDRRRCIIQMGEIEKISHNAEHPHQEFSDDEVLRNWRARRRILAEKREEAAERLERDILENILIPWTGSLDEFLSRLCAETERSLGPAPCQHFSLMKLGSLARTEACLYSDLEFALIWSDPYPMVEEESIRNYFKAFIALLELKIISLGETNQLFERGPDFKLSLPGGLRFDEGGNYPFNGMVTLAGNLTQLMNTASPPESLWNETDLTAACDSLRGTHDTTLYVLTDAAFLYGSEILIQQWRETYQKLFYRQTCVLDGYSYAQILGSTLINYQTLEDVSYLNLYLKNTRKTSSYFPQMLNISLSLFRGVYRISDFHQAQTSRSTENRQSTHELALIWRARAQQNTKGELESLPKVDIKKHLLRFPQMMVAALALFSGVPELSSFARIQALKAKKVIHPALATILRYLLGLLFTWRMRAHQRHHSEDDLVSLRVEDGFFSQHELALVFYLIPKIYPFLKDSYLSWKERIDRSSTEKSLLCLEGSETMLANTVLLDLFDFLIVHQHCQMPNTLLLIKNSLMMFETELTDSVSQIVIEHCVSWLENKVLSHSLNQEELKTCLAMYNCVVKTVIASPENNIDYWIQTLIQVTEEVQQKKKIEDLVKLLLTLEVPTPIFEEIYQKLILCEEIYMEQYRSFRYFYYEALSVASSQSSSLRQAFAPILDRILELPDFGGVRVLEKLAYQHLDQAILQLSAASQAEPKSATSFMVSLIRSNGQTISLHQDVVAKIINHRTGHLLHMVDERKASTAYQHRNVAFLNHETSEGIIHLHFKEHPDFPMMAYASDILSWRLCGHGSTPNELVLFEVTSLEGHKLNTLWYPVLVSLTVPGQSLRKLLDSSHDSYGRYSKNLKRLSEVFILEVLKHSGDGFPRNYVLAPCNEHEFSILCIDSEQIFVHSFVAGQPRELSITYCLPEFQAGGVLSQSLDQQALVTFANLGIERLLNDWLHSLAKKETAYRQLMSEERFLELNKRSKEHPFILLMEFSGGMVGKLAADLRSIKALSSDAVKNGVALAPKTLLRHCSGDKLANLYFPSRPMNPSECLTNISNRKQSSSSREYGQNYFGRHKVIVTIEEAIREIRRFHHEDHDTFVEIDVVTQALVNQNFIFTIDFSEDSIINQLNRLERLANSGLSFKGLTIKHSSILDDDWLERLLQFSFESLTFLSVHGHEKLTERFLSYLSENFPNLQELVASGVGARYVHTGIIRNPMVFRSLKKLIINHCDLLERLYLRADHLEHIESNNHKNLKKVIWAVPKLNLGSLGNNTALLSLEITTDQTAEVDVTNLPKNCDIRKISPTVQLVSAIGVVDSGLDDQIDSSVEVQQQWVDTAPNFTETIYIDQSLSFGNQPI